MTLGDLSTNRKGQPPRAPDDRLFIGVKVEDGGLLITTRTKDGDVVERLWLSEFNAWALWGTIAIFLGVKLPKTRVCRAIKIWSDPDSNRFTLKIG